MFRRPSKLFVVKFLGLWGTSNVQLKDYPQNESEKAADQVKQGTISRQVEFGTTQSLEKAIKSSSKLIVPLLLEKGVPGLTISVSRDGNMLWNAAFGYCDVENQVECEPDARFRIASISKSIFATTIVAPMIEQDTLKLETSVHNYLTVDEFPKQKFLGKEYDITIGQLLSHTSGIKSYGDEDESLRPIGSKDSKKIYQCDDEYNRVGYYQRETFRDVISALKPFKNENLISEPGKSFKYTTYGYTLLSAVAEKVHQQDEASKLEQIEDFWVNVLRKDWKMKDTVLDHDEVIVPKRARYYLRAAPKGGLINAPYTDMSVKWAGGGLLSTSRDLIKFGHAVLDCYNQKSTQLKRETIELLWKEVKSSYGLGFNMEVLDKNTPEERLIIYHTGSALGASSVLIIYPASNIVVAILTNLGCLNLYPLGRSIKDEFEKVKQ